MRTALGERSERACEEEPPSPIPIRGQSCSASARPSEPLPFLSLIAAASAPEGTSKVVQEEAEKAPMLQSPTFHRSTPSKCRQTSACLLQLVSLTWSRRLLRPAAIGWTLRATTVIVLEGSPTGQPLRLLQLQRGKKAMPRSPIDRSIWLQGGCRPRLLSCGGARPTLRHKGESPCWQTISLWR